MPDALAAASAPICCALLQVVKAVQLMILYKVTSVSPRHILQQVAEKGDDNLFYTVFELLLRYNMQRNTSNLIRQFDTDKKQNASTS